MITSGLGLRTVPIASPRHEMHAQCRAARVFLPAPVAVLHEAGGISVELRMHCTCHLTPGARWLGEKKHRIPFVLTNEPFGVYPLPKSEV